MAKIERSIEINVPVSVAYRKLSQFEEFPRFMKGVHSVHQLDEAHLHWRAEKGGKEMEWDAEITQNIPEKSIAWRNTSGPRSEGRVDFEAVDHDKTRISLYMDADEAFLRNPYSSLSDTPQDDGDLARFKKMVESEEYPGAGRTDMWGTTSVHSAAGSREAANAREAAAAPGARKSGPGSERPARQSASQMQQVWDDPIRIVRKVGEEMEQLLGRWIGPGRNMRRSMLPLPRTQEWSPPVDVEQYGGQLHICADLPGVSKQDVQIEIIRGQLMIEGERRGGLGRHRQEHRYAECNHGHFYRSIPLPEGADPDSAQATMHDGVLDITLRIAAVPDNARRLDIRG